MPFTIHYFDFGNLAISLGTYPCLCNLGTVTFFRAELIEDIYLFLLIPINLSLIFWFIYIGASSLQIINAKVNAYGTGDWQYTRFLSTIIDDVVRTISQVRFHNLSHHQLSDGRFANFSTIQIESIFDFVKFAPNTCIAALFSPFPKFWFESESLVELIYIAEASLVSFGVAFGVYLGFKTKSKRLSLLIIVMIIIASFYVFCMPNIGTLIPYNWIYLRIIFLILALVLYVRFHQRIQRIKQLGGSHLISLSLIIVVFLLGFRGIAFSVVTVGRDKVAILLYIILLLSILQLIFSSPILTLVVNKNSRSLSKRVFIFLAIFSAIFFAS